MEKGAEKLTEVLSKVRSTWKKVRLPSRNYDCLAEEELDNYYQGNINNSEKMRIDKHLGECQFCSDRLFILNDLIAGEMVDLPQRLITKTKKLIFGHYPNLLEIVLSATQKAIQVIKNTGELLSPSPLLQPARGQESKVSQEQLYEFINITKEFEDLRMDIQIECVNDSYKVILNASDPVNHLPLSGARLALFSDDRELSSVEESEAIFYLKLRKYLIKIIFEGNELGQIQLDLRKAS